MDKNSTSREVFGIPFRGPIGLAAGSDVNADHIFWNSLRGFSFLTVGPVYPKAQGKSKGLDYVIRKLLRFKSKNTLLAADICKNDSTLNEFAASDYEKCFALLYDFASMFIVNLAHAKNTDGSSIQIYDNLPDIIDNLLDMRMYFDNYKPILVRIQSGMTKGQTEDILDFVLRSGIDGIVTDDIEAIKFIRARTNGLIPLMGSAKDSKEAREMIEAGASLVETLKK